MEELSTNQFDLPAMKKYVERGVFNRFVDALVTGAPTTDADKKVIAEGMFKWARERGATDFAHWFFPCRGGSGAVGGACGALKYDTLIDLDFSSTDTNKP